MKLKNKRLKNHLKILNKMKFGVDEEPLSFYQRHKTKIKTAGAVLATAALAAAAYKGHKHMKANPTKFKRYDNFTTKKQKIKTHEETQLGKRSNMINEALGNPDISPETKLRLEQEKFALEDKVHEFNVNKKKRFYHNIKITNPLDFLNKISTLSQDPLIGPLVQQAVAAIPKMLEDNENVIKEAEEEIDNQDTPTEQKETAKLKLNDAKLKQKQINTLTDNLEKLTIKYNSTTLKSNQTSIHKKIQAINSKLEELNTNTNQTVKKRRVRFGSFKEKSYKIKQKFYTFSKVIAKGLLVGIGIFAGVSISLISLLQILKYRNVKLDPTFVTKLFESTDKKGNLHVDNFIDSLGTSSTRWWDNNGEKLTKSIAKEIRKEVPDIVTEATTSGIGVIQENTMTLMMPMMMALSSYFSKQMQDLTIVSAKKSRSDAAKLGYQNRVQRISSRKNSISGKKLNKSDTTRRRYAKQLATKHINDILDKINYKFGKF